MLRGGIAVERDVRYGHGVRHERNEFSWQDLLKSFAQFNAYDCTGLQQRTVCLDLGQARPHRNVVTGPSIEATHHGIILSGNRKLHGRRQYPEQRQLSVSDLGTVNPKHGCVSAASAGLRDEDAVKHGEIGPYRPVAVRLRCQH
jgi:hypothetical protein